MRRTRTVIPAAWAVIVALSAAMPGSGTTALKPYVESVGGEYVIRPLFSVDDVVPETSHPTRQYRMVGIPDGLVPTRMGTTQARS
jgi:hypothetical protein